jgi:hypothetical protein
MTTAPPAILGVGASVVALALGSLSITPPTAGPETFVPVGRVVAAGDLPAGAEPLDGYVPKELRPTSTTVDGAPPQSGPGTAGDASSPTATTTPSVGPASPTSSPAVTPPTTVPSPGSGAPAPGSTPAPGPPAPGPAPGPAPAPANRPPVAVDDHARIVIMSSLLIPVLANDSDPDDGLAPSTLRIVTPPDKGYAVVESGKIRYNAPFLLIGGTTQLRYSICDTRGACATAWVTIDVPLSL